MYTTSDTSLHAQPRTARVYRQLKTGLLQGDYPLNMRLGEERLAAQLGCSRTPVREALSRLHSEGLVVRLADGGFAPLAPDVAATHEVYELRLALELYAIRRPVTIGGHHDRDILETLADRWRRLEAEPPADADPTFVLADEAFHIGLASAAGNVALVDVLRQLNERIRIVRMQDFLSIDRIVSTIAEHLGILDVLLAGDLPAAEAALATHIEGSKAVVDQRVLLAIARMAGAGGER